MSLIEYKTLGKGENAGHQHFLISPQCFEKASFPHMSKGVIVWEWVKRFFILTIRFAKQYCLEHLFENTVKFNISVEISFRN